MSNTSKPLLDEGYRSQPTEPIQQRQHQAAVALPEEAYCALEYAERSLAAIANKQEIVGDLVQPIATIAAASKRAKLALERLQAVAHHFAVDLPHAQAEQPASTIYEDSEEHSAADNETFRLLHNYGQMMAGRLPHGGLHRDLLISNIWSRFAPKQPDPALRKVRAVVHNKITKRVGT